jgi:DhnA family fructose-bisphosphate aldolase class Ia
MASPGKELRLGNIFADDGRAVIVAMDHGGYAGPMDGIRDIGHAIETVADAGADAVLLTPGMVRNNLEHLRGDLGVILRVDSTGSIESEQSANPYSIIDIEEALKLGVDGVIAMGYLEGDNEVESLSLLTSLASDCSRYEMPFVAEMLPLEREAEPDAVELGARMGSEFGADLIKTYYTGDEDSFRGVVESTPTDIVMLGGPKRDSIRAVLQDVEAGIRAGAVGIAMGRNIWQAEDPAAMVEMMQGIVHDGSSTDGILNGD